MKSWSELTDVPLVNVTWFEDLGGLRVRLGFDNGAIRDVDLSVLMVGPVFKEDRASGSLAGAHLANGTLTLPGGGDFDPGILFLSGDVPPPAAYPVTLPA